MVIAVFLNWNLIISLLGYPSGTSAVIKCDRYSLVHVIIYWCCSVRYAKKSFSLVMVRVLTCNLTWPRFVQLHGVGKNV